MRFGRTSEDNLCPAVAVPDAVESSATVEGWDAGSSENGRIEIEIVPWGSGCCGVGATASPSAVLGSTWAEGTMELYLNASFRRTGW